MKYFVIYHISCHVLYHISHSLYHISHLLSCLIPYWPYPLSYITSPIMSYTILAIPFIIYHISYHVSYHIGHTLYHISHLLSCLIPYWPYTLSYITPPIMSHTILAIPFIMYHISYHVLYHISHTLYHISHVYHVPSDISYRVLYITSYPIIAYYYKSYNFSRKYSRRPHRDPQYFILGGINK